MKTKKYPRRRVCKDVIVFLLMTASVVWLLRSATVVQLTSTAVVESLRRDNSKCHTLVEADPRKSYYRNLVDMESAISEQGGDMTVGLLRYHCQCSENGRFALAVNPAGFPWCATRVIEFICPELSKWAQGVRMYLNGVEVDPGRVPPLDEIDIVMEKELGRLDDLFWCDRVDHYLELKRISEEMSPAA